MNFDSRQMTVDDVPEFWPDVEPDDIEYKNVIGGPETISFTACPPTSPLVELHKLLERAEKQKAELQSEFDKASKDEWYIRQEWNELKQKEQEIIPRLDFAMRHKHDKAKPLTQIEIAIAGIKEAISDMEG